MKYYTQDYFETDGTPPLCRTCGTPIAKATTNHRPAGSSPPYRDPDPSCPRTIDDCRKLTNEQVVRVEYTYRLDDESQRTGDRWIDSYSTWDGRTYVDEFFCTRSCAETLGRACARQNMVLPSYNAALRKQRETES